MNTGRGFVRELFAIILLCVPLASLAASEKEKEEKSEEPLDEELSELEDADYPDLVGFDDTEMLDEFALLQEEDIVFSAAKHEQDIAESPSAISVITREQIENTYCNDLACLLRQMPEVDVRRVRPLYTLVGARAYSEPGYAPRALVLVDGREINVEMFGFPLWQALPVHLEDIDRVEVIRGPGSALYGANAHSMVVSITTRKPSGNAARVFMAGGEHDTSNLHLNIDRALGAFFLHISGDYESAGHWQIQDKREREFGRFRLRLDHEAGSMHHSLQLGLLPGEGMFHSGIAPGGFKDGYLGYAALSHRSDFLRAHVTYRFFDADLSLDLPLYYGDIQLGEFPEKFHVFTGDLDTEVQLTWSPFKGNLLIAGSNYRWIHVEVEQNAPPGTDQHRIGVFLHDEQRLGKSIVLTAGVRFDYNNITPFTISPRVAGIWQFAANQFLRLAIGRAFRKPNFFNTSVHFTGVKAAPGFDEMTNLFRKGIGNEKVGNENITAFEAGYRGRFLEGRLKVEADLFFNLYRDTISFLVEIATDMGFPDIENSVMKFVNQKGGVNTLGGSVSLTWNILEDLRLSTNYTLRNSWYISEVDDDYAPGETAVGDRVPWEHAHLFNLWLHYLPERGLRLGAALHGASSADTALPGDGTIFGEVITVHTPARVFASGFAAWRLDIPNGWFEVGLRAYNLFQTGFRDSPSVTRADGVEVGGELIGRRILLFLRAAL